MVAIASLRSWIPGLAPRGSSPKVGFLVWNWNYWRLHIQHITHERIPSIICRTSSVAADITFKLNLDVPNFDFKVRSKKFVYQILCN